MANFTELLGMHEFGNIVNFEEFFTMECNSILPLVEPELNSKLPLNMWQTLTSYQEGKIAMHSINVLYRSLENPMYQN